MQRTSNQDRDKSHFENTQEVVYVFNSQLEASAAEPPLAVIVVGAGGAHHAGMPLGAGLCDLVAVHATGNRGVLTEHLALATNERSASPVPRIDTYQLDDLLNSLRQVGRISIDEFVSRRAQPELRPWARLLISSALHERQRQWAMQLSGASQGDWYGELFEWLYLDDATAPLRQRVRIVTFNYDLSLEMQLAVQRRAITGCTWQEAIAFVQRLPIVHVHGALECTLGYNGKSGLVTTSMSSDQLVASSANICLAAARNGDVRHTRLDSAMSIARKWVAESPIVGFCGYGFHGCNNQSLSLEALKHRSERARQAIHTTTRGWTQVEAKRFNELFDRQVQYEREASASKLLARVRRAVEDAASGEVDEVELREVSESLGFNRRH